MVFASKGPCDEAARQGNEALQDCVEFSEGRAIGGVSGETWLASPLLSTLRTTEHFPMTSSCETAPRSVATLAAWYGASPAARGRR